MQNTELERFKNIFKKLHKIPPGELQECGGLIKWGDETAFVSSQWSVVSGEAASRGLFTRWKRMSGFV